MTFAEKVLLFYQNLRINSTLPEDVEVLDPYRNSESYLYCSKFYKKYYNDTSERMIILGINPGRHGGGITGVPFTDPVKLEQCCDIPNPFVKKTELSADFIYAMIKAYGGPENFYSQFYFSAISPLGFTQYGRNLNYYDIKELQFGLKDFIVSSLLHQLSFGINQSVCFCLGEGQNFKFLSRLNEELKVFQKIVPLAHPRFIMQYRRKQMDHFVRDYVMKLSEVHSPQTTMDSNLKPQISVAKSRKHKAKS